MPFKIVTVPFNEEKGAFFEEPLNHIPLAKRIIQYRAEFFTINNRAYWTVFVEYEAPDKDTKDDVTGLNEIDMLLYKRLKEWRRVTAEKRGVPVFIVANNTLLKNIAIKKPVSIESLKSIKGFGKGKIEHYGKDILDIVKGAIETQ